jgi:hypothetical protein
MPNFVWFGFREFGTLYNSNETSQEQIFLNVMDSRGHFQVQFRSENISLENFRSFGFCSLEQGESTATSVHHKLAGHVSISPFSTK